MKFHNTLLASAAAAALMAGGAFAADLPVRSAAPAPIVVAPVFTWSGFYVGVNAGYGGDRFAVTTDAYIDAQGGFVDNSDAHKMRSSGFLGGVQVGYNWQFANRMVLGLEADYQWTGIKGDAFRSNVSCGYDGDCYGAQGQINSKITGFGTVRARLGYAFDRSLLYVTGGWAYGRVKSTGYIDQYSGYDTDGASFSRSNNMTGGWTVGAGLEYALTNNLSFKTEYLFVDLGKKTVLSYDNGKSGALIKQDTRFHVVRAGLNYRFGWGSAAAPVVARY